MPGWTQSGAARTYDADNLFEYMDGNAEGYIIYGFQNMQGVTCKKGGVTLVVDISEMADADSAYGMFTREPRPAAAELCGRHGRPDRSAPRLIFAKGKYYVEIAANPEGDHTAALKEWATALDKTVRAAARLPPRVNVVPHGEAADRSG